MNFNDLFNSLWGMDGIHPFGNPFNMKDRLNEEGVEKEVCEFVKGNFKTIITCTFNKQGFLLATEATTTYLGEKEDLQKLLDEALEKEDYLLAAEIKKKIDVDKSHDEKSAGI